MTLPSTVQLSSNSQPPKPKCEACLGISRYQKVGASAFLNVCVLHDYGTMAFSFGTGAGLVQKISGVFENSAGSDWMQ